MTNLRLLTVIEMKWPLNQECWSLWLQSYSRIVHSKVYDVVTCSGDYITYIHLLKMKHMCFRYIFHIVSLLHCTVTWQSCLIPQLPSSSLDHIVSICVDLDIEHTIWHITQISFWVHNTFENISQAILTLSRWGLSCSMRWSNWFNSCWWHEG